MDVNRKWNRGW